MNTNTDAFHKLAKTGNSNRVSDLSSYRIGLDVRIDGVLSIRNRLSEFCARRRERSSSTCSVTLPSPSQALFHKQFEGVLRVINIFTDNVNDATPISEAYINIGMFIPQILIIIQKSIDSVSEKSQLHKEEMEALFSACALYESTPFTFADAFDLVSILQWSISNGEMQEDDEGSKVFDSLKTAVESGYKSKLELTLQLLSEAQNPADLSRIAELVLDVRTNLVLDSSSLSVTYAAHICDLVDQITALKNAVEQLIIEGCRARWQETTNAALAFDWHQVDTAIGKVDRLRSLRHIEDAFDLQPYFLVLRLHRMTALAAYLFVGEFEIHRAQNNLGAYPNLLRLINALQAEHRPIKDIDTLLSIFQANDLRQCLQISGHINTKEILIDAIKTLDFMLPLGCNGEALCRDDTFIIWNDALGKPADLLTLKFLASWFIPPLLLSAFQYPDEQFTAPTTSALTLFKSLTQWKGFDDIFCGLLLRAFDVAYPEHPPLLVGHALNTYPVIMELYRSVPTEVEGMVKVLHELYGINGDKFAARLKQSSLHTMAIAAIDKTCDGNAKNFLRNCYVRTGFIVTDDFCNQLYKVANPDLPILPHGVTKVPKDLSAGWWQHHESYVKFRSQHIDDWSATEQQIGDEAATLCETMLEKTPVAVTDVLEKRWTGSIRRILVARRVLIGMAKGEADQGLRLYKMGFIKDERDLTPGLKYDTENYRQYYHKVGLKAEIINKPLESDGLWPEERDWYIQYTPPIK